jgi:hypothetical protein
MNRRTGVLALATSLTLAAGLVTVVVPAAAVDEREWISAGDLTLSAATGKVTFDGATQALGSTNCNLTTSADLLEFAGFVGDAPAPVGYKSGSIGVNERVSALCNLVDPATTEGGGIESLDLKLGDDLVNFAGRPLQASGASLDLRMGVRTLYTYNKRSTVTAQAYLDGAKVGDLHTLIQGTGTSGGTTTYCAFTSYGQTCGWDINPEARFDTLRLTAVAGAFGVVGESTIALESEVDKALSCEDPVLTQGNASVEFIGNAGPEVCTEFGVTLEAFDEEIVFLKRIDLDPAAQFIFDVTWKQTNESDEGDPAATVATVPNVTIDFENYAEGSPFAADPIVSPMPFCPDYLYASDLEDPEAPRVLVGVQDTDGFNALPDWRDDASGAPLDGKQYACLDQPRQVNISDGTLTVTDRIYLIGDARMRLG